MMDLEQYNKALENVVKSMKNGPGTEIMTKLGVNAKSLINDRIIKTGTDAHGKKFPAYSAKDTLVGSTSFLVRKDAATRLLGSKPKRKELEWRTVDGHHLAILKGGYKKIRELQGRQTAFVDFSMTGRMWDDINVRKATNNTVEIGAKEQKNKDKLEGNTKRKGEILELNSKEIDQLKNIYNLKVLQVFKENGL